MSKLRALTLLALALGFTPPVQADGHSGCGKHLVKRARFVMGTLFEIRAWGDDRSHAESVVESAFAAVRETDRVLSDYREDSEATRLNRAKAGEAIKLSAELCQALMASLEIARDSDGAFDPTVRPLATLWRLAAERGRAPSGSELDSTRERVGWRKLRLLPGLQVEKAVAGLEVDFGGIGKGWALDQAAEVLRAAGVRDAYLSAGESTVLALGDDHAGRGGWRVLIRDPRRAGDRTIAEVILRDQALSTSASYEKFVEIDGRRYGHIVDPRNGLPVASMLTTSVIALTAAESDALSTAAFVLGSEHGGALLRRRGAAGLLVSPEATTLVRSFLQSDYNVFRPTAAK